jgi:hypothetical protein
VIVPPPRNAHLVVPVDPRLRLPTTRLIGYFDESGTNRDAGILAVGGYVASVEAWTRFARDWFHCLANAGLDPTKPFHRTDFEARPKPQVEGKRPRPNIYEGMPDRRKVALRDALGNILHERLIGDDNKVYGVAVAVSVVITDYEGARGTPLCPGNRYSFCALQCVAIVSGWLLAQDIPAPVAYVFEDGAGDGDEQFTEEVHEGVKQIFSNEKFRRDYRFGSLDFRTKKECPQLQAADFAVWDIRRQCLAEAKGQEYLRGARHSFTVRHFDKETIARSAAGLEETMRKSSAPEAPRPMQ